MKHSELWRSDNLKSLIHTTGVVIHCISKSTGIPVPTIQSYLRGRSTPSIDNLIAFADFFDVPLDFICGRYSLEDAKAFMSNYAENFMKLRRDAYEQYLIRTNYSQIYEVRSFELPWPYNILKVITDGDWTEIYTEDQMDGLNKAISSLSERDQKVIRMYFEQGIKFEDIGKDEGVTGARIREIAVRAIKILKHPDNLKYITKGIKGSELESEYNQLISKLAKDIETAKSEYNEFIKSIARRKRVIAAFVDSLEENSEGYDLFKDELIRVRNETIDYPSLSATIYTLDLTVRTRNCLARSRIKTIKDVVEARKDGRLEKIPGLGKKGIKEILSRVNPEFLR